MPDHCLIVVSAPCVVEIDTDGELVLPVTDETLIRLQTLTHTQKSCNQHDMISLDMCNVDMDTSLPPPSFHTIPTNLTDTARQVPIREYLEQTLRNLQQQRLVVCVPSCLTDMRNNSLQVMCHSTHSVTDHIHRLSSTTRIHICPIALITRLLDNSTQAMLLCEQGRTVDDVVTQLHHIGVGSLVGSISVVVVDDCSFLAPSPPSRPRSRPRPSTVTPPAGAARKDPTPSDNGSSTRISPADADVAPSAGDTTGEALCNMS